MWNCTEQIADVQSQNRPGPAAPPKCSTAPLPLAKLVRHGKREILHNRAQSCTTNGLSPKTETRENAQNA
jgi:hypothetical protein